jgi:predicted HTH domain antitoxin
MKLAFELDLPDGAFRDGEAALVRAIKEQAAIKLYADGRVTTGEAAAMLDLNRIQFLDVLRRAGTEFRADLDEEDIELLRQRRDAGWPQAGR